MGSYPRFDLFFGIAYDESLDLSEINEDLDIYEAAEQLNDHYVQCWSAIISV